MTREEVVVYLRQNGFVQIESKYHVDNYAQFSRPEDKELARVSVDNEEIHFWEMLQTNDRRARVSRSLKDLDNLRMKHIIICHEGVIRWLKERLRIKG